MQAVLSGSCLLLQERVRVLHGELLRAACTIHPVPRVVDAVALGLGSKSNRTRIVCMDALSDVLRDYGVDIFQQARSRPFHSIAQVATSPLSPPVSLVPPRKGELLEACTVLCRLSCAVAHLLSLFGTRFQDPGLSLSCVNRW